MRLQKTKTADGRSIKIVQDTLQSGIKSLGKRGALEIKPPFIYFFMKKYFLIPFILIATNCLGQTADFTIAGLDSFYAKKTIVYINATWCLPCMKKEKELVNFYNKHKDSIDLIIAFDTIDDPEKAIKHIDTLRVLKTCFIARSYYNTTATIQINPQRVAFKRMKKELKARYPYEDWTAFSQGSAVLLHGNKAKMINLDTKKMSNADLEKIFLTH